MQHGQCSGVKKEPYDTVEHDRWSGMKVKKEEQQELNQDNVWAKLVPVDSRYSEIDMVMQETGVFSEITSSSPVKQNWCVISRKNLGETIATVTVRNTSAGTILVDGSAVQREDTVDIHNGSIIVAGSELKGYLHYTFKILQPQGLKNEQARLTISLDVANSKCSICLNIWHDVVTVAPCLHNFCNGCFTEWLKSSQNNYKNVICPQCRVTILSVGRNHFLHNIEETILLNFPLLKRSKEELALLDQSATVQTYLVFGTQGSQSRKRPAPTGDYDDMDSRCPQCVKKLGGFKCNQSTIHLQCHICHGLMPSRPDFGVPQNCLGCNKSFCAAYWQTQDVKPDSIHTMCNGESFKPIYQRTISMIPDSTHQNNRYEQAITKKCIEHSGKSVQAVISDWIVKFGKREIDRTKLPLSQAEIISPQSHLCNDCYSKLVGFLLYWFRVSMPKSDIPLEASDRQDCWYGHACRTQHHNLDHAEKRNHVCRPTRGNPNTPLTS